MEYNHLAMPQKNHIEEYSSVINKASNWIGICDGLSTNTHRKILSNVWMNNIEYIDTSFTSLSMFPAL